MIKAIVLFCFLMFVLLQQLVAGVETDSSKKIEVQYYLDLYYSYDFNTSANHVKPSYIYNYNRHNELNLNLATVKFLYKTSALRASFAPMVGTYAQYNLKEEPLWAQFINEANIGYKLAKNTWVDVGILPSHIGFESAIGGDCWNLTRSIVAENSPYYESGIKLSRSNKKENVTVGILLLNGWQRIQRINGQNRANWGLQLNYKPNNNLQLNYSNFYGSAKPDDSNSNRLYHNFYGIYSKNKWGITTGFDFGSEFVLNKTYNWLSPVLIFKYVLNPKYTMALRAEYFRDKNEVIVASPSQNGFKYSATSGNVDCKLSRNLLWRVEAKLYNTASKQWMITSALQFKK